MERMIRERDGSPFVATASCGGLVILCDRKPYRPHYIYPPLSALRSLSESLEVQNCGDKPTLFFQSLGCGGEIIYRQANGDVRHGQRPVFSES